MSIVCRIASPLSSERPMVGVGFLITGTISRPGTVNVAGLGAAVMAASLPDGQTPWYLLWVPSGGDVGSKTLTATGTETSTGATSTASVTFTVVASASFPAIATPAVWFDGRQQAWADAGATVPANAPNGIVQRVNEPSPLTGSWTAPSVAARPLRDAAALRFNLNSTPGGGELTRPDPGGIFTDACTIVVAFVARASAGGSPLMGLFESSSQIAGIRLGGNQVWGMASAGNFFTGLLVAAGKLNVIALTFSATGVEAKLDADGTVTTATWTTALTHTAAGSWVLGLDGSAYFYGSQTQAMVFASSLSSTDRDAAMAWAKAQPAPQAYPDDRVLLAWAGDSIPASVAASYATSYPHLALAGVRSAGYPVENYNVSWPGAGVNRQIDSTIAIDPPGISNLFRRALAAYSATRLANVLVIALGTNNLIGDNSVEFILHGTGAPNNAGGTSPYPGSGIYPMIDAAVAAGWRVAVVVPGPRSDNPSFQATYNLRRGQVCDDLVANAASHAAPGCPVVVVDTRTIAHWGVDGDSDNTTYYSADKVHPLDAGHAIVAPYVTAAILDALTPAPTPPPDLGRRYQMQGRNVVTQQIVTWVATGGPDWLGEQSSVPVADVVLYTSAGH